MVRIINGEIVSDNDPRVTGAQRRSAGSGGGSGGAGRGPQQSAGYGRVASLLDPPSKSPANGEGPRWGQVGGGRDGGAPQPGPLDKLAEMIGVHGRYVTIPGGLGVQENQVPLIYLLIAALVVLFGGWKAAAIMVFAYVIINQKGQLQREAR